MDDLKVKHQIVYILSPQDDWKWCIWRFDV